MSTQTTRLAAPTAVEVRRWRFIFLSVVGMLLLNIPADLFALGWQSAAFNTFFVLAIFIAWSLRKRDPVLLGWLLFGVAAGFTELIADWWLVHKTQSLVYPQAELVASPFYMPFAWTLIMAQMLGIAHWLRHRMPLVPAALVTALICGVNIPIYEHLAKDAGWWYYTNTPLFFSAPYYIILGEAIIGLPLVLFASGLSQVNYKRSVLYGVLCGLSILIAYMIAWWLVGPCTGAVLPVSC
ncbi:MAG: hypothetical protein AAFY88_06955 [Acidobacteriota bacterium]